MQSLSDFNSLMALHSSLDMLALNGLACLRTLAMSDLSSSASLGFRLWHASSIAAIYSWYGEVLGVTAKFGPCDSTDSCAADRGLLDKFTTHCLTVESWSWFEGPAVPLLLLLFVLPLCCFLCHRFSNFFFWHTITFICLASFKFIHKPLAFFHKICI